MQKPEPITPEHRCGWCGDFFTDYEKRMDHENHCPQAEAQMLREWEREQRRRDWWREETQ